jgi:hypothetical protein
MTWKSIKGVKPPSLKRVWISYYIDGILTKQYQTYAKAVGKDPHGDIFWHDFMTGKVLDNSRITVSHWMAIPDNPILNL